ncbi:MAG: TrmH family RNA methyltransferase [Flavobacteriaceae bacterium]|nr:TrmH family RNA methyltransferase [Flavobacteriaceae bacterium]
MPTQLQHNSTNNSIKKFPIKLLCDEVKSPSNIGALFRICDALGVSEIVFYNSEMNIKSSRLQKTARSTQKKVLYRISTNIISEINQFKKEGFQILALEITDKSILIEKNPFSKEQKVVVIIGNEQNGISEDVLNLADKVISIPMFGENSSMNVVQATSIALYTIINKLYIY